MAYAWTPPATETPLIVQPEQEVNTTKAAPVEPVAPTTTPTHTPEVEVTQERVPVPAKLSNYNSEEVIAASTDATAMVEVGAELGAEVVTAAPSPIRWRHETNPEKPWVPGYLLQQALILEAKRKAAAKANEQVEEEATVEDEPAAKPKAKPFRTPPVTATVVMPEVDASIDDVQEETTTADRCPICKKRSHPAYPWFNIHARTYLSTVSKSGC
eukprot:scaffold161999_cov90-Attheya_sp.AAC.7